MKQNLLFSFIKVRGGIATCQIYGFSSEYFKSCRRKRVLNRFFTNAVPFEFQGLFDVERDTALITQGSFLGVA